MNEQEYTHTPLVLLIEDDRRLAGLIKEYLVFNGYRLEIQRRGDTAAQKILDLQPDLVVLDLMLPGEDGLSVCRGVRPLYRGPILILTAREDDMDQVAGLELGADDYVKKPVHPRVLLARIRALLRRTRATPSQTKNAEDICYDRKLTFGNLVMDPTSRSVILHGQPMDLTSNEFDLLWVLALHAGEVMDRNRLSQSVRGIDYDGLDRSMDIAISRLRKKLSDSSSSPRRIKTVWGRGYLFVKDAWGPGT